MKTSLHFVFFCMITVAFYFISRSTGSSASSTFHSGRRTVRVRVVPMPSADQENRRYKTQAIYDETKKSTVRHPTRTDDFDENVYHTDYHGVTTHPTPTPRHPKP